MGAIHYSLATMLAAWPQVARRTLANWRLMCTVIVGVLLASAIMAGTVIYFDALRELALKNALSALSVNDSNIALKSDRGPTTYAERDKVVAETEREIGDRVAWMLRDKTTGVKTATFFLSEVGEEASADTDNPRTFFGHLPRLPDHVTVVSGEWPADGYVESGECRVERGEERTGNSSLATSHCIEALVPLEAAEDLGVGVGDTLAAVPYWSDTSPFIHVVIAGTFTRDEPDDEFWYLDDKIFQAATARSFETLPFYLTERTYYEALGDTFRQMDSVFSWLLMVDTGRLDAGNATFARRSITAMEDRLSTNLFSYRQITELDEALFRYDVRLFFSKLPMFVILILISVVILYYVVTLSSLVVEQQRGEIVLLKSRGSSAAQVLSVYVLEGITIAALAVAVAPPLAAGVISLLGVTPAFSDLSGGQLLSVSLSPGAYMMSALGGLLSFAALMVPAVQASRMSVTTFRHQSARPYTQPFYQRYYLDVLLLIVGALLLRQLSQQGSVVAVGVFGEVATDQLLLAVPAVVLVASALVLLRLFPLFMRASSALLSSFLSAGLVLGIWQMARNPTHYARLSLMLILMAGLGIFAASFGGTLQRSFTERALYSTGTDVRLVGALLNTRGESAPMRESYEDLPAVEEVGLAFRGFGSDLSKLLAESYTMFAVEGEEIGRMGWFRDDFSETSMDTLLASLPSETLPVGIELPADAVSVGVIAKPDRPHPSVALALRMRDANGRYFTYPMGRLVSSEEWSVFRVEVERSSLSTLHSPLRRLEPARPLTLVSLTVFETNGRNRLRAGSISIDEIFAVRDKREKIGDRGAGGALGSNSYLLSHRVVLESFDSVSDWTTLGAVPESRSDVLKWSEECRVESGEAGAGHSPLSTSHSCASFIWVEGRPLVSRGIFHGPPLEPIPVLATSRFLRVNDHRVGEVIEVSAQGHRIDVVISDVIEFFPTLETFRRSYLVADLDSVSAYANLEATGGELRPNEVWMTTNGSESERARLMSLLDDGEPFPTREIHDRVQALADSTVDPLVEAGWRALLFVAFAAVLVLSGLGFLVHAYVSFKSREIQFALMRTVGFSMSQLSTLVLLEQVLVIGAGLALGTWMGGRLGATMMPFLGHDDSGTRVLPPFVVDVNWGTLAITYVAMGLLFAVIIAGVIILVRRISLQRILRLGEV